jgi:FkbM family methyltransferase
MKRAFFDAVAWYVERTPPHPGRGVLARLAYRLDPHDIVHEMAPGVRIRIRIDRDEELAYWANRYDLNDDVQVFASLLKPGMVVVDVGANIGMYTLFAARAVGPSGRVLAFEPVPALYDRLAGNVAATGVDSVSTYQVAISDRRGNAPFHLGRSDSMGSLVRAQTSATIAVPTESLDDFLERQSITRVDMVKIDAEGAEMQIVGGMRRLLARTDRPVLFIEHNDLALRAAGSSAEELFATIVGYGYAPHLVERGRMSRVSALAEPFHAGGETFANYVFLPEAADSQR